MSFVKRRLEFSSLLYLKQRQSDIECEGGEEEVKYTIITFLHFTSISRGIYRQLSSSFVNEKTHSICTFKISWNDSRNDAGLKSNQLLQSLLYGKVLLSIIDTMAWSLDVSYCALKLLFDLAVYGHLPSRYCDELNTGGNAPCIILGMTRMPTRSRLLWSTSKSLPLHVGNLLKPVSLPNILKIWEWVLRIYFGCASLRFSPEGLVPFVSFCRVSMLTLYNAWRAGYTSAHSLSVLPSANSGLKS